MGGFLCGFQHNADLNASKNIILKYLDATGYPDWATVNLPNGDLNTAMFRCHCQWDG